MTKNILYLVIYLFTEFITYTLAYVVIFGASLTKNRRKIVFAGTIIFIFHFGILYCIDLQAANALSLISMLIIPIFFLEPIQKKYFLLYPFVVIGTSVIGVSISFFIAIVLGIPEYMVVEGNWITIICQCMQGGVLLVLFIYRKLKKSESYEVNLDLKQYVLFYVVIICLFLMLTPIQALTEGTITTKDANAIGGAVSVACIVLIVVTIWQGIVINRESQLKERNRMNEKYMELQKEYYTELLQQDEKMRRFRHDMNAHMVALQSYCTNGNNENMQEYINNIVNESAIYEVKSYTGNRAVDAVIRQLHRVAKKHRINIEVEGNFLDETVASEYDLCVIISNLLKNAIEACEKISDVSQRKVVLFTGMYNTKKYIIVKNTVAKEVVIEGKHLYSTKKKSPYHGLGSGNIENAVKKYNGIIEYNYKDGWFEVEVSI